MSISHREIGEIYINSNSTLSSTANGNVVTDMPATNQFGSNYVISKIKIINDQDCHIIITTPQGATSTIHLRPSQGWSMGYGDVPLTSIKFVEAGITYDYYGTATTGSY